MTASGAAGAGARRPVLEVLEPGLLTTIQDSGRRGHRSEGVPLAGACDPVGLAVANLLMGNAPGDAAIECTITGPELLALDDVIVGLGGADLGAVAMPSGRRLLPGRAHRLSAGERLVMPGTLTPDEARDGLVQGCRAYVAVPGGIDEPVLLGSRSTSRVGGFGGHDGRPLRAGDQLTVLGRDSAPGVAVHAHWPSDVALPGPNDPVRILPGPPIGAAPDADPDARSAAHAALLAGTWRVGAASDRRGLRLEGPPLSGEVAADAPSHGVIPGAIQLTPSGQPLVLLSDAGTTGGYPVIGVAIAADLGILGQARPGAILRFVATDAAGARAAAVELRARLAGGAERLAAERLVPEEPSADPHAAPSRDAWDDLADSAGG